MVKALGLNTISTYVFWNFHEMSDHSFDFAGSKNVSRFIEIAEEEGMLVMIRPGPYVCAEWDFGGLPIYLLNKSDYSIRSTNAEFIRHMKRYLKAVSA
jgi:beta-galactosidase